ncbi:MAG: cytochrome c family protein [Planctomycetes bacterium]|nr:cytochrome c family protein [Planctomycetota bacterium]MBM4079169.1 cytochrome c family protein [Planctomycetota bacterium]MBM4083933.1 cytochrome c family protein [Planctomycetota bacterium]
MKYHVAVVVIAIVSLMAINLAQAGDAAKGEKVAKKCAACHTFDKGGPARVGPNLSGVVGRKAGAVEGFKYSEAMVSAGILWQDASLDKYLTDPKGMVPRNRMTFPGLKDAGERADLIEYLKTLK